MKTDPLLVLSNYDGSLAGYAANVASLTADGQIEEATQVAHIERFLTKHRNAWAALHGFPLITYYSD